MFYKLFQKKTEEEGTLPKSFYDANITWYQNKTKISQENYGPIFLMNIGAMILNKTAANQIQKHIKDYTPWLRDLFQEYEVDLIYESNNVTYHIKRIEGKSHMIISTDRKVSDKIQHIFKVKTLNKLGI